MHINTMLEKQFILQICRQLLCTTQDVKGVPSEGKRSFLFLLTHERANRSLFSASVSLHKPLFVLLGSFKRVIR